MSHSYRYFKNLSLLNKTGGLIFCSDCQQIIGELSTSSYSAIQLYVCCTCGTHGLLQISDKAQFKHNAVNRIPGYINKKYLCSKCKTSMFSIIPDRVKNYGFYVKCSCGEEYDTRVEQHKNLNETIQLFRNIK